MLWGLNYIARIEIFVKYFKQIFVLNISQFSPLCHVGNVKTIAEMSWEWLETPLWGEDSRYSWVAPEHVELYASGIEKKLVSVQVAKEKMSFPLSWGNWRWFWLWVTSELRLNFSGIWETQVQASQGSVLSTERGTGREKRRRGQKGIRAEDLKQPGGSFSFPDLP